jgi:hypothetical protein
VPFETLEFIYAFTSGSEPEPSHSGTNTDPSWALETHQLFFQSEPQNYKKNYFIAFLYRKA